MAGPGGPKIDEVKKLQQEIYKAERGRDFERVKKLTEMLQKRVPLKAPAEFTDPKNRLVKKAPKNLIPLRRGSGNFSKDSLPQDEDSDDIEIAEGGVRQGPKPDRPEVDEQLLENQTSKTLPPGGPAIEPSKKNAGRKATIPPPTQGPVPSPEGGEDEGEEAEKPGIAKNAINKFREWATKKLSREALKTALKAFRASPYFLPAIGIILVILIIFGGLLIFTNFFGLAGRSPSESGQSMVQTADPVKDRDAIAKILALSGDDDVMAILTDETLVDIKNKLISMKAEINKPEASTAIDQITSEIESFKTSRDKELGNKIVADIKELLKKYNFCSQIVLNPVLNDKNEPILNVRNKDDKNGLKIGELTNIDGQKVPASQGMCLFMQEMANFAKSAGISKITISPIS